MCVSTSTQINLQIIKLWSILGIDDNYRVHGYIQWCSGSKTKEMSERQSQF